MSSASPQFVTATVSVGGKQFRVKPGDTIRLDRLPAAPGEEAVFDQVRLAEFPDGAVAVGRPNLPNARVTAVVDARLRGEKLRVFKFRRRKNSKRSAGHRQELTQLTIRAVHCDAPAADAAANAPAAE